jgi:hypothetical protein
LQRRLVRRRAHHGFGEGGARGLGGGGRGDGGGLGDGGGGLGEGGGLDTTAEVWVAFSFEQPGFGAGRMLLRRADECRRPTQRSSCSAHMPMAWPVWAGRVLAASPARRCWPLCLAAVPQSPALADPLPWQMAGSHVTADLDGGGFLLGGGVPCEAATPAASGSTLDLTCGDSEPSARGSASATASATRRLRLIVSALGV